MTAVSFAEAYRTHEFRVAIGATECPVTKVTGLNLGTTEAIDQYDSGSPVVRKVASGVVKFDPLVITRYVDGTPFDQFFQDWFSEMFQLNGPSGGSSVRRNGSIMVLRENIEEKRFTWVDGFVVSAKFADFEAGSANLWTQEVTIAHCGLSLA